MLKQKLKKMFLPGFFSRAFIDLYTTDIHNRMLRKRFFSEDESSETYGLWNKNWKEYLEKQCSLTANQKRSIFQDFKHLEETNQLMKGDYKVLRNFFYIDSRSLRIIDAADESIEFIRMIFNKESMPITGSMLDAQGMFINLIFFKAKSVFNKISMNAISCIIEIAKIKLYNKYLYTVFKVTACLHFLKISLWWVVNNTLGNTL